MGVTKKEHDSNLVALLERSREKNVTFNRAKCEFRKDRVVFYCLMFSKDGVSPDPCKVKAIKSAGRPRNAAELNSFLFTVRSGLPRSLPTLCLLLAAHDLALIRWICALELHLHLALLRNCPLAMHLHLTLYGQV